jgi:hypothetical protein
VVARRFISIVLLSIVLIAVIAVLVFRWVAAEDEPRLPRLPPQVTTVQSVWNAPIILPADLPTCLGYAPDSAAVVDDQDARGGRALRIHYDVGAEPSCTGFQTANLVLTEADALYSLQGEVTTLSYGRMQFARVASPDGRLTLQWLRDSMMCRLSATLGGSMTEDLLLRIAESARVATP